MKGWTKEELLRKQKELWLKVEPCHWLSMGIVYLVEYLVGSSSGSVVRAMIGQPKGLLMDEPFSALDAISRKQLQVLIEKNCIKSLG